MTSEKLLDLSKIRTAQGSTERYEKVYGLDAFPMDEDESYRVAAPVTLAFDLAKDGRRFRLVGSVATTLELPCSRCLEPFALPMVAQFDLCYRPQAENTGDDDLEIQADDLSTAFYQNDEIDLGQLMREQFYLSLPMKPLCGGECRGLCPICGTNLNTAACDCKRDWDDPRFATLGRLKGH